LQKKSKRSKLKRIRFPISNKIHSGRKDKTNKQNKHNRTWSWSSQNTNTSNITNTSRKNPPKRRLSFLTEMDRSLTASRPGQDARIESTFVVGGGFPSPPLTWSYLPPRKVVIPPGSSQGGGEVNTTCHIYPNSYFHSTHHVSIVIIFRG